MNIAGPLDVFTRASLALTGAGRRNSPAYENRVADDRRFALSDSVGFEPWGRAAMEAGSHAD